VHCPVLQAYGVGQDTVDVGVMMRL